MRIELKGAKIYVEKITFKKTFKKKDENKKKG